MDDDADPGARDHDGADGPHDERGRRICGARNRSGGLCKRNPSPGRQRCRFHGGTNPGAPRGNRNAWKHGVFSAQIRPEERVLYARAPVGDLAELIRFEYLRLARIAAAEARARADGEAALEDDEHRETSLGGGEGAEAGAGPRRMVRRVRRMPDWDARWGRGVRRIRDLELAQRQLTGGSPPGEQVAEVLRRSVAYHALEFYGCIPGVADRRREEAAEAAGEGAGELAAALDDHGTPDDDGMG